MTELLTIADCARKADVSESTIKRDIVEGKLTPTRIRGCVKIHPGDWEEYLQKCRSAPTAAAGKFGFNTLAIDLPKLLGITETPRSTKGASSNGPQIIELAARRNTRSRKRSGAG